MKQSEINALTEIAKKGIESITQQEVEDMVIYDINEMFKQKMSMSEEYAYGRMTVEQFVEDRKKRSQAGITGWFGIQDSYFNYVVDRVFLTKNLQVKINLSTSSPLLVSKEKREEITNAINNTVAEFLENFKN